MSIQKKVRPSSALGKLETYNVPSLFGEIRQTSCKINGVQQRAKTALGASKSHTAPPNRFIEECNDLHVDLPDWLEKELIRRKQRRHSLGLVENVTEKESLQNQSDPMRNLRKEKMERQVTLKQLKKLKDAFEELESNGQQSLDMDKFKWVLKKCTGLTVSTMDTIF
ncbi:hypothetical protein XELAEV_18013729mg [Xenopus laevis]|uniref:EF-hand domain-containing protein n=1 Tax=Xenopus laevis TaxID=8355 RepID=A0A974HZA6_XENLA|nr:hypothetical protein XELAEV_18013729mg [Xenopus laevis]